MALNNHIKIPALNSIYSDNKNANREIDVYYSLPEKGINEDTGVLLYIYGFRGYSEAKVFKKLRNNFADEYNLITVQCDYFGYEFMQNPKNLRPQDKHMEYFTKEELIKFYKRGSFRIKEFYKAAENYPVKMLLREDLSAENPDYFNDMGIMQAMDNLNALLYVMNMIHEMGFKFNSKKVILYGNSQGAYLSHLCNVLAPDLASLIIDNSGWLFPKHLEKDSRTITKQVGQAKLKLVFDYKARDIIDDFEILDLEKLYSSFENKARIIAFHGEDDHLISLKDKTKFISKVKNASIYPVTSKTLGNYTDIFSDTTHGLGANFLTLFKHVLEDHEIEFENTTEYKEPKNTCIETSEFMYIFDYTNKVPRVAKFKKKTKKPLYKRVVNKLKKKLKNHSLNTL